MIIRNLIIQVIFFSFCNFLQAYEFTMKSSQSILEQVKKNYQESQFEMALQNIEILKSPYFPWSNKLLERYWYELNVYQAVCDKESFNKTKSNYKNDFSNLISKIENSVNIQLDPLIVQNIQRIPAFFNLTESYNKEKFEALIPKKGEHNINDKDFSKKILLSTIAFNEEELLQYIWIWHQAIVNLEYNAGKVKLNLNKRQNYFDLVDWKFNGEYWKGELFSLKVELKNKCLEKTELQVPPSFEWNNLFINSISKVNANLILEKEINQLDKEFKNIDDGLPVNFQILNQMANLWMMIESGGFVEAESKERFLSIWEMRFRNAVIDTKRFNLDGQLEITEAIRAYQLYLATIKPTRFEMAMTRHLAQMEETSNKFYSAGKHFETVYDFNKERKFHDLSLKNYQEEINKPENNLNLVRSKKAMERLKLKLSSYEKDLKAVNPSTGN